MFVQARDNLFSSRGRIVSVVALSRMIFALQNSLKDVAMNGLLRYRAEENSITSVTTMVNTVLTFRRSVPR